MLVLLSRALFLGAVVRGARPCNHGAVQLKPAIGRRAVLVDRAIMLTESADTHMDLVQVLGERDADRLMRVSGIRARVADGSLASAIPQLDKQFSIRGGNLVSFMSGSVAARLGDESFWAALARLRVECGISGGDLVTFMSDSVAARLDSSDFMDSLAFMCSQLSPLATVAFMKNNDPFASRLSPSFAHSVVSIVQHLDSHGFAGAPTLKALVGKSPLAGRMPELQARVLSLQTRGELDELVKSFRGSYAHKRSMACALAGDRTLVAADGFV